MIQRIYIPTAKRADNQITYNNLPDDLKKKVIMVLRPEDRLLYKYDCEYLVVPDSMVGSYTELAETRKLIHKHAGAIKYAMVDDDIVIKRRNAKYWTGQSNMEKSQRVATSDEILELFNTVDNWLDEPDIGVVGLADAISPPGDKPYRDTTNVNTYVFYDGRMISEVIDDMDITSVRVAEDMLFLFEALSRGINSRRSEEYIFDNRSQVDKDLQESRIVWKGMFDNKDTPEDYFQTDEHYNCMRYIQKKYPHGVKIYEKDGKLKNTKYWRKVYEASDTHKQKINKENISKSISIIDTNKAIQPKYPLYVVSKGRWDTALTSKALSGQRVKHNIVIENQEYKQYKNNVNLKYANLLVLDPKYQDEYDTCDDLGDTKSKGPGAARNFAWEHSIDNGHDWHWVMDDNINLFIRFNMNRYIPTYSGGFWRAMEDFMTRYENLGMGGPEYYMFITRRKKYKPFRLNTRIYSCNFIRNSLPYRWRGRYNEDTILSLDMLKEKWCTMVFHTFLQWKLPTQTVKGGNTKEFYEKEGTLAKSKMQVAVHPDVSELVWKYNRWHHKVDYARFKTVPKLKQGIVIPKGNNEYGMTIKQHRER